MDIQQQTTYVQNLVVFGTLTLCNSANGNTSGLGSGGNSNGGNSNGGNGGNNGTGSYIYNFSGNDIISECSCDCSSNFIIWPDITSIIGDFYDQIFGTQVVEQNMYVGGCVFSKHILTGELCAENINLGSSLTINSNANIYNQGHLTIGGAGSIDVKQPVAMQELVVYGNLTLSNNASSSIVNGGIFNKNYIN